MRELGSLLDRQAFIKQELKYPLTLAIILRFRRTGNQQHELAALAIGIGQQPVMRLAERAAVDRFVDLGQLPRQNHGTLRPQDQGQRDDGFQDAMRRFVEN